MLLVHPHHQGSSFVGAEHFQDLKPLTAHSHNATKQFSAQVTPSNCLLNITSASPGCSVYFWKEVSRTVKLYPQSNDPCNKHLILRFVVT